MVWWPARSSRTLALRRAPRKPRALGDLQHGWRLGLCQWARGAGDPLGADPYEFVACLVLKLCLTRIPRPSFDSCLSLLVWRRWFLEMLVRLVLAARLGQLQCVRREGRSVAFAGTAAAEV